MNSFTKQILLISFIGISISAQAWPKFKLPKYSYPNWKYSFMVSIGNIDNQLTLYSPTDDFNFESGSVDYDRFLRNGFFQRNYSINRNFREDFPELEDTYDNFYLINYSNPTNGRDSKAYLINLGIGIKPWLGVNISLGQASFRSNYSSHFLGQNINNSNPIEHDYELLIIIYTLNTSSLINNYQLRLKSPFLWDVIGVFYEVGFSLQYNYNNTIEESANLNHFDNNNGVTNTGEYQKSFQYQSVGSSLDVVKLPFAFGVNLWLSQNIMLEGSASMRRIFDQSKYAPAESVFYSLGLRIDAAVFKGDQ